MRTLTIDIGGTGIKLLPIDDEGRALAKRHRELTPKPSTPDAVMAVIREMVAAQEPFDRVSAGFPGVVRHGVIRHRAESWHATVEGIRPPERPHRGVRHAGTSAQRRRAPGIWRHQREGG